jgi:hypothetical protein
LVAAAAAQRGSRGTAANGDVAAEHVDRLWAEMLALAGPLAAELRDHLPEIEWSEAGAAETTK